MLLVKDEIEVSRLTFSNVDLNLFIYKGDEGLIAYVLVFVDDMLIIGLKYDTDYLKSTILRKWKGKDLGLVDTFIGL